jgi:hypothetical protein
VLGANGLGNANLSGFYLCAPLPPPPRGAAAPGNAPA